jgi:Signal transduction histidine kinase, nitrogen specific
MLSSDYISNLTDHLQQAVLAVDQSGIIVYCNYSASHYWQRGIELLLGCENTDLFHSDLLIQQKIREVLDTGKVCRLGGYVLQTPPLHERGAEIVIAPVRNESGLVYQAVITLLENTSHQEFQAREHEEKLARFLGDLAGSLAHEIQNPLSGIKGMLQLLQRDLQKTKFKNGSINMMLKELDRVERLLKQLLLHSGPMPLDFSRFNIHELLNTVIQFEKNSVPGIKFKRIFDTSLPEIKSDRDKLHQVFLNLLRNAAEASKKNSTITISTRFCGKWELTGTILILN